MRYAILCQCFGVIAFLAFQYNLMQLYFLALKLSQVRVFSLLGLVGLTTAVCIIPAAFLADRIGKKISGNIGSIFGISGYLILALAGFFAGTVYCQIMVAAGIMIFSLGWTMFLVVWLPLLRPIVPSDVRGRFFGKLRVSWQLVGLGFFAVAAWMLGKTASITVFQLLMLSIAIALFFRMVFFQGIPEVEKIREKSVFPFKILLDIIRYPGLISFAAYLFLLFLFTTNSLQVFTMIEKEIMNLPESTVVWLANVTTIGNVIGFFLAGMIIDRLGTKPVFLFCHFGYAAVLFVFLFRGYIPALTMPVLWSMHFIFGLIYAFSSIAVTTETLALLPTKNQTTAAALIHSVQYIGRALAAMLCAAALDFNFLKETWNLCGMKLSNYDSILMACAIMILLLVITLGLVPSILHKAESSPSPG